MYIMYIVFFFEGGWLITQMLTLAYGGGTANAYFCKQGYLVGQKWSKKCLRNLPTTPYQKTEL